MARLTPEREQDIREVVKNPNLLTVSVVREFVAELDALRAERGALQGFKDALINAHVVGWSYTAEHETNPRKAVDDLIRAIMLEALDPLISQPAHDLHERIKQAEAERDAALRARDYLRDAIDESQCIDWADYAEGVSTEDGRDATRIDTMFELRETRTRVAQTLVTAESARDAALRVVASVRETTQQWRALAQRLRALDSHEIDTTSLRLERCASDIAVLLPPTPEET